MAGKSSIHSEVLRLFGAMGDDKVRQIDKLSPALDDLEIAAAYLAGMNDVMGKERLPLSGKSAEIYEIVIRDDFPGEDEYRPE